MNSTERQELLNRSVTKACVYADPQSQCNGRHELLAHIEQFKQAMPGKSFRNHTFLNHHNQSLAEWTLNNETGAVMQPGTSYACFGEDGRLTHITGFFKS